MSTTSSRRFILLAGTFGFLGVASGAFGAHALKEILTPDLLAIFETGSRYCLQHAMVLFATALYYHHNPDEWLKRACLGFIVGIVIFSGSLWTLALTNTRWLGAITPIGGVGLLVGWFSVIMYSIRFKEDM